jgi:Ribosomal protein L6e
MFVPVWHHPTRNFHPKGISLVRLFALPNILCKSVLLRLIGLIRVLPDFYTVSQVISFKIELVADLHSSPQQMPRNKHIVPHVGRLSRSQVWTKRGCHKGQKTSIAPEKTEQPHHVEKQIGGANNGGVRLIPTQKASRFYPADDVKKPKKSRKTHNPTVLRSSITPGTVLILLAGRFKGKRVVFLKQLASGLLLVTGPYKINGVPLRRVNQAYAIATSTKIDLPSLKVRFLILPPPNPGSLFLRYCY